MLSLKKAVDGISLLSPEGRDDFFNAWKRWEYSAQHLLLKQGQISDYIYFLEKGAARIFYKKDNREITEWLALDEQFFLSITSFFERTPSRLIIHTLEPVILWGIHYTDLMRLAEKHHDAERLLRKMLTRSLVLSQQRMESIQFENARQRYERLLLHTPQIIQRVPLMYIASFLGVTLETLSRIRSGSI